MQAPNLVFKNIHIYEDGQEFSRCGLAIEGSSIAYAGEMSNMPVSEDAVQVDAAGWWAAPGLVDLQLNGGFGYYFSNDPARVRDVAIRLPEMGVTAFLPTLISEQIDSYPKKIRILQSAREGDGARVLGVHLEGPFLSREKPGAHPPSLLIDPVPEALARLQPLDAVKMVTLAPELPHGMQAIQWFVERGVVVSIGHSQCDLLQLAQAARLGASCATHLFNAMPPLNHREPGMVAAMLTGEEYRLGLIVDGIHVHPEMVKLVWKCRGARGIMLVSDAMGALGMPPGMYQIGEQDVVVDENSARLRDGKLAGSILRMDDAVRNMVEFSGCTRAEAVRMASTTPMEALGLDDRYGHVKTGYQADLVFFDEALRVQLVMIDGKTAFATPGAQARLAG